MAKFLHKELTCISSDYAERLVEEMRAGVECCTSPKELDSKQVEGCGCRMGARLTRGGRCRRGRLG